MGNGRILIVDDENSLRKVLADILRRRGYRPEPVATGEEAIRRVQKRRHDVAILDLGLTHMSGIDVMREIRSCSPNTACIVLTGRPSQESAIQAVNLGAWSYLKKPFNVEELLNTIHSAMNRDEEKSESGAADPTTALQLEVRLHQAREHLTNMQGLSENILKVSALENAHRFAKILVSEAVKAGRILDELLPEEDATGVDFRIPQGLAELQEQDS